MNLVTWDPYRDLSSMPDRFHRLFRRDRDEEISLGAWIPPVDILEDKERILLTAELPGFKESDIEVLMEGGVLTIRGERKNEAEKEGRKFHRVERVYGQFERLIQLPMAVQADKVKAGYRDGVLEITLPKAEELKPREIKIEIH